MNIIESIYVTEQFRFPRTKKRRIRNKWTKRDENHRPKTDGGYMMGDTLICHPIMAQRLKRELSNNVIRRTDALTTRVTVSPKI